jgi:hypothetical protein
MPPTKRWHEINRSFEIVLILLKKPYNSNSKTLQLATTQFKNRDAVVVQYFLYFHN